MARNRLLEIVTSYNKQELGEILDTIIANDERQLPIVDEPTFLNKVLPLLVNPWSSTFLQNYRKFVGELHQPLRVAGLVNGETKIIFTVPPIYPKPDTTVVKPGGVSVPLILNKIARDQERTSKDLNPYILEYLTAVASGDGMDAVVDRVLRPIALILARYNRTFVDDRGNPLYRLDGKPVGSTAGSVVEVAEEDGFDSNGFVDD